MSMVYCRGCGHSIHETALACPSCGAPTLRAEEQAKRSDDAVMKHLIPVGRSGWAVAAGYLAFFSLFLVPAPAALFCGIMGLRDIRRHPEKLGKPRAIFGIVMGALGSVLLLAAILGSAGN